MDLISPKKAAKLLCVSVDTLRLWEIQGIIKAIKTPKNHRRYFLQEIEAIKNTNLKSE